MANDTGNVIFLMMHIKEINKNRLSNSIKYNPDTILHIQKYISVNYFSK